MSTTTNSFVLFSLKTSSSNRFQAFSFNPMFTTKKNKLFGGRGGGQRLSRNADGSVQLSRGAIYRSRDVSVYSSILPSGGPVLPSGGDHFDSWKSWILGIGTMLTFIIPIWRNKWGPLLQLKRKVGDVVQTVEDIAETVEEVAEKVEEMTDEFGDRLPPGKLKDAAEFIENAAKEIAKDAHLADEVIDKVQEMDKEIETMVERVNDQVDQVNDKLDEISKDVKDLKN